MATALFVSIAFHFAILPCNANAATTQENNVPVKRSQLSSQLDTENPIASPVGVQPAPGATSLHCADSRSALVPASPDFHHTTIGDGPAKLLGVELTQANLLTFFGLSIATGLVSYSLITSGRKGWGWFSMLVALGVVAFFGRMSVAIFREMAGGHTPTDWDED